MVYFKRRGEAAELFQLHPTGNNKNCPLEENIGEGGRTSGKTNSNFSKKQARLYSYRGLQGYVLDSSRDSIVNTLLLRIYSQILGGIILGPETSGTRVFWKQGSWKRLVYQARLPIHFRYICRVHVYQWNHSRQSQRLLFLHLCCVMGDLRISG